MSGSASPVKRGAAREPRATTATPLLGRVIGVYGSAGAPWHHLGLAAAFGAQVRPVRAEDIRAGRLAELDAFVMPGGGAVAMAGLLAPLGEPGALAIRRWVEEGGTYVSSCAGSVLPLALADEAAAALPVAACMRMTDVPMANPGDPTLGGLASPGVGRIRVRVDATHPYAEDLPETVDLVHYNGPFFDVAAAPESATPFAWPVQATEDFTAAERFLPGDALATVATADLTVTRCIRSGAATAMETRYGAGRVVMFGSHPEFGLGPLALGWGQGARLLVRALRGSGSPRPARSTAAEPGWTARTEHVSRSAAELARAAAERLEHAGGRFADLAYRDGSAWLDAGNAPALGGRDARTAWRVDGAYASATVFGAAKDLAAFADRLGEAERPWLDDAPREDQDVGWMGLVQLVDRMHRMLDAAEAGLTDPPQRPAHAYDLFGTHPFHLAVGTYLSAAGLAAGALLTTVVLARCVGAPTPEADLVLWTHPGREVAA